MKDKSFCFAKTTQNIIERRHASCVSMVINMKDFEIIKNLIGENVTENDLENIDCFVHNKLGLFIPSTGACGYASKKNHTHPSYMVTIVFENTSESKLHTDNKHYSAYITSPLVPHDDGSDLHYYCLLIDKEYFESQYKLYSAKVPKFRHEQFEICHDILKALNTFAFEYSKKMMNSDVTLDAQASIITHWIIRSILGENLDMRAISSDYSVARAQHYIEMNYGRKITVNNLAELGFMSPSSLNRIFKKETGKTPIDYLIEIRLANSKILLRRKSIPITEIALKCGFNSSAHFSSCFFKNNGITPTEYRSKYVE